MNLSLFRTNIPFLLICVLAGLFKTQACCFHSHTAAAGACTRQRIWSELTRGDTSDFTIQKYYKKTLKKCKNTFRFGYEYYSRETGYKFCKNKFPRKTPTFLRNGNKTNLC